MESNILSQTSTRHHFINKYGDAYLRQVENLKKLITQNSTGPGIFSVFGMEAGLGKSKETDRIVVEYLNKSGEIGRKFLIVKPYIEDVLRSVTSINENCTTPYTAVGIISENWNEISSDLGQLQFYPVIVITHSRYWILRAKPNLNIDDIDEFKKNVDANAYYFKANSKNSDNAITAINEIYKFIEDLYVWNNGTCLYDNGRISAYNEALSFWTLNNNIILDANADIDRRYKYASSGSMKIYSQPKLIDRSNTTLHTISFNASKSNISRVGVGKYLRRITQEIKARHKSNDKTLIITHKSNEDKLVKHLKELGFYNIGIGDNYKNESIAVVHFGAIIGKNYWRDFSKVWVIANPIFPMESYVLYWMFFSLNKIKRHNLKMYGTSGKYQFRNKQFEDIRLGCIISHIYQAIMRVNREGKHTTEIYIAHSDNIVINEIAAQLKNVSIGQTIELDGLESEKDYSRLSKENKGAKLAKKLSELKAGIYAKSTLYNMMGWNQDGNISKFLRSKEVKEAEAAGIFAVNYKNKNNKVVELL